MIDFYKINQMHKKPTKASWALRANKVQNGKKPRADPPGAFFYSDQLGQNKMENKCKIKMGKQDRNLA